MVSDWQHLRRGAGALGCLLSLLLFAGALYYGVNIGQVYLRYYTEQVDLPLFTHTFVLRPKAEEPL
ncbi:MAG TPA: hypothetical protein VF252_10905 [Gemmatimonadales bacterium]